MGCNSHLTVEIQGQWEHAPTKWSTWALDIPESRDYALYEAMAGVRGEDGNALVAPRGIPADADTATEYWIKRYGEDGHTHSWLYPKEFHAAVEKVNRDVDSCWIALDQLLQVLEKIYGENHARVVFYFDN